NNCGSQPTCRCQEDAVRCRESRTTGLATQDCQVVTLHVDLQILELAGTKPRTDQLQYALERYVTDLQKHNASSSRRKASAILSKSNLRTPQLRNRQTGAPRLLIKTKSAGYSIQIEFAHTTGLWIVARDIRAEIREALDSREPFSQASDERQTG